MNILYLIFSFTVGGTEKLTADICNEMVSKNGNVYLYIVNKHYDEQMLRQISSDVTVFCRNRVVGDKNKFSVMWDIYRYCIANQIDVVHCNSLNAPELLLIAKILNPRLKVIYTIHGLGQYSTLNKARVQYRNLVCNSILAISDSVKEDLLGQGAQTDKVSVIYNAINLEKFASPNERVLDKNNVVIGNVARINLSQKGQDVLIKAIGLLKDRYNITCYFAGEADSSHKEELEQLKILAADVVRGSACEIVFLGNVADIPGFLKGIDLFVLPSRLEGFGISLIEALYMGIPCISSDINGPREIVGDNERGDLFEQGDPSDLADKLAEAIENFPEKKEKAYAAAAYVRENFDIREMCGHLLDIYG